MQLFDIHSEFGIHGRNRKSAHRALIELCSHFSKGKGNTERNSRGLESEGIHLSHEEGRPGKQGITYTASGRWLMVAEHALRGH